MQAPNINIVKVVALSRDHYVDVPSRSLVHSYPFAGSEMGPVCVRVLCSDNNPKVDFSLMVTFIHCTGSKRRQGKIPF